MRKITYSLHALEQMIRRKLTKADILAIYYNPDFRYYDNLAQNYVAVKKVYY